MSKSRNLYMTEETIILKNTFAWILRALIVLLSLYVCHLALDQYLGSEFYSKMEAFGIWCYVIGAGTGMLIKPSK